MNAITFLILNHFVECRMTWRFSYIHDFTIWFVRGEVVFDEMGFFSTLFGLFGFGFGISVGLVIGYLLFIYVQSTDVQVCSLIFMHSLLFHYYIKHFLYHVLFIIDKILPFLIQAMSLLPPDCSILIMQEGIHNKLESHCSIMIFNYFFPILHTSS